MRTDITSLRRLAGAAVAAALVVVCSEGPVAAQMDPDLVRLMRKVARQPLSDEQRSAAAVVLHDASVTTVSRDGHVQTRRTYVARLRTREGRDAGSLGEVYPTDTGRVRVAHGWIIRPNGEVQGIPPLGILDVALAPNDVYNEARLRLVTAGDTEPETLFGAEIVSEDRAIFTQLDWPLQERWPVVNVERVLNLPPGWSVSAVTFNHTPIDASVTDRTWTWAATNLPALPDEPASPPVSSLVPRVAVTYRPSAPTAHLATFDSWASVSTWLASLADPQAAGSEALLAEVRRITAGATTAVERISAIAAWVQRVPYVSIQIGIGRGGGYRPRRAADVFARNHGDCKDKATLMRTMLAAVGIRAHPVAVYVGDRTAVRESWPSPHQFNHVILAISIADLATFPSVSLEHPTLGPLAFFDPTDPHTRIGTLPDAEQGSLALVVHPSGSGLVRLPEPGPGAHASHRVADAVLRQDGTLELVVTRRLVGRGAAAARALASRVDAARHRDIVATQLNAVLPGAQILDTTSADTADAVEERVVVAVRGYAQPLPGALVLVTPPFRVAATLPTLSGGKRSQPVVLDGLSVRETLTLVVPAGWNIDELPASVVIERPFGLYRLVSRVDGTRVVVERSMEMPRAQILAGDHEALRRFIDEVRTADTSPLVLVRTAAAKIADR